MLCSASVACGLFLYFMSYDAAHGSTGTRAGQATAQHIAHHAADDGTGGGILFLTGHAGTACQNQRGGQQGSAQQAGHANGCSHGAGELVNRDRCLIKHKSLANPPHAQLTAKCFED